MDHGPMNDIKIKLQDEVAALEYELRNELPKEDLIWLYDRREFDAEGKVTGRALYPRVQDGGR